VEIAHAGVLQGMICSECHPGFAKMFMRDGSLIDWIICAPETGPKRRLYDIEWIRDIKNQCVNAGVPFFLKHLFEDKKRVSLPELDGRIWNEYPNRV